MGNKCQLCLRKQNKQYCELSAMSPEPSKRKTPKLTVDIKFWKHGTSENTGKFVSVTGIRMS